MLIRATIVLLVVLNLGVAAWWLWRPAPVRQPFEQPAGVPRLVLLEEIVPTSGTSPAPAASPRERPPVEPAPGAAAPETPAPPEPDPVAPPAPSAPTPESLAGQPRCEGAGAGEARGWRVYLPPATDLATAEATARRIAAAGFSDYLVLRDGESANAISLGLYSTEASAQRRGATLRAAGFPARCARIPATTPA